MKTIQHNSNADSNRSGSTLIIVIALLGLLAFTGMLMYTFAAQERAAAEYFSEGAKTQVEESDDPFPWALEQMIVGPSNQQKTSILWSPTRKNSFATNTIGADVAPHTGTGLHVAYSGAGLPIIDSTYTGAADPPPGTDPPDSLSNRLNFVDAAVAWAQTFGPSVDGVLGDRRDYLGPNAMPEPDVDYTYPDINHLFLAYKGWSIRDNGAAAIPRYERVFTIIPSFFRPQYMKSSLDQGPTGIDVPTDPNWYDEDAHPQYSVRSFRPSALHVAGFNSANMPVLRFLDATNPAHAVAIATLPNASGAFPLRPGEGNTNFSNSTEYGRLGAWTGHGAASAAKPATTSTPALPATFELDSDNDGDGIREGIWLDLHYPLQETAAGVKYVVLHSFTIEDLDALIDLNSHGNLAGLPRTGTVPGYVGSANLLGNVPTSQSNQGLGPHEINPLYALLPFDSVLSTNSAFDEWYGSGGPPAESPSTLLEQANMEWLWLMAGRIEGTNAATAIAHDGRWGDASALWYHRFGGGGRSVTSLPRPGRSGNLAVATSNVAFNFGGLDGFDDNQDTLEGIASQLTGRIRGFVHPIDYAARGRRTVPGDPRVPNMYAPIGTERWVRYLNYSLVGNNTGVFDSSKYLGGPDGTIGDPTLSGDNLTAFSAGTVAYNANFDDPYETIMDFDHAVRPDDQLYSVADTVAAHLTMTDKSSAEGLSNRLENLAPITFAGSNVDRSSLFTTLSNSFRYFSIQHDLNMRPWEWTADSDGDSFLEFPPAFGPVGTKIPPFTAADPFRPQTRRLLFAEATEGRGVQGQLPLSVNHILDVNRSVQTPLEGTPEFVNYMKRSGLRFRPLSEHPLGSESDGSGGQINATLTTVPNVVVGSPLPVFPPQAAGDREFWARRDRQLLARDIYVLLYTIGGAQWDGTSAIFDYTSDNSARGLYSEDKLRQMAQFAVNLVDAMDTDDVITKFEFDKSLGDGWNLDDDAFTFSATSDPASADATTLTTAVLTKEGMYPDDTSNRGVVYGVEAQPLTFSEVLAVRSKNLTGDHAATHFDDSHGSMTSEENDFLFFELQNVLPTPVSLGSGLASGETVDNTVWRVVRRDRTAATDAIQSVHEGASITPPATFLAFGTDTLGRNQIDGGGRFTVSGTNAVGRPGFPLTSCDLFVDAGAYDGTLNAYTGNFDSTYELIAPNSTTGTMPTATTPTTDAAYDPRCDLDMIAHATTNAFYQGSTPFLSGVVPYAGHNGTGPLGGTMQTLEGQFGASAESGQAAAPTTPGFDLVLERRLNPDLPSITNEVFNPWIEIDRVRVTMLDLNIDTTDTAAEVRADSGGDRLKHLTSFERSEPLVDSRAIHGLVTTTATAFRSNSLKGDASASTDDTLGGNSNAPPGGNDVWQPHFDRDFASVGELLNLPVFPPNLTTQKLNSAKLPAQQQLETTPSTPPFLNAANAAALFLWPDLTPLAAGPGTIDDNRWYRLLQFVEVPSRVNRMLGNYISIKRLPGKLNPNTIRHREVYAGLLDDTELMNVLPAIDSDGDEDEDGPFTAPLGPDGGDSIVGGGIRDRWFEFINERDGNVESLVDPTPLAPLSGDEVVGNFWIPGTPNSRPFRSFGHRTPRAIGDDNGLDDTLLRRLALDRTSETSFARTNMAGEGYIYSGGDDPATNRNWLEVGNRPYHIANAGGPTATTVEHHQLLSKIMNNTTTVSNTFIIYGTAAYFEAYEDPATGLIQVGGRMGLDLDSDSDQTNDAGWEQRAVFIIDRTELYNAYDPGTGSVDWKRIIKNRANLASDGK
ncbi:MAG: hypothetical protein WKF77_18860 [Planctomycetaceae bacterium]